MSTTTHSDAIRAFAHRVKEVLPANVYLLNAHPYEGNDENVHVAIIADVDNDRLNKAQPALSQAVEDTNIELGFDPLIVYHIGQPHNQLAEIAQQEGVQL
jgi:hypothetical protein